MRRARREAGDRCDQAYRSRKGTGDRTPVRRARGAGEGGRSSFGGGSPFDAFLERFFRSAGDTRRSPSGEEPAAPPAKQVDVTRFSSDSTDELPWRAAGRGVGQHGSHHRAPPPCRARGRRGPARDRVGGRRPRRLSRPTSKGRPIRARPRPGSRRRASPGRCWSAPRGGSRPTTSGSRSPTRRR